MTTDEKLAAILAAVQTDPGNRGLARDPHDNLFTATNGDFERACYSIADCRLPIVHVITGFMIPTAVPPSHETDGPLGAVFLARALSVCDISVCLSSEWQSCDSFIPGLLEAGFHRHRLNLNIPRPGGLAGPWVLSGNHGVPTHTISLERAGRAANGHCYTMKGRDISEFMRPVEYLFQRRDGKLLDWQTIGIGDGGNEIGMGKIPHETIVKNIPNGDKIHCRVPTDHLIVAGVSNWGAYALAAGIFVLKGITPPPDLFDPNREREILEVMVREGPLVDGVTGKQEATVDGLSWEEYSRPLVEIARILRK